MRRARAKGQDAASCADEHRVGRKTAGQIIHLERIAADVAARMLAPGVILRPSIA
jgi:hypothetical protein